MPTTHDDFLTRARELAAAQRHGLLPPPGKISRELVAKALRMSPHTARQLEQSALLKLRSALERDGISSRTLLTFLSADPR